MEFSAQVLWAIIGGFIGASLVSLVFLFLFLTRRGKITPQPKMPPQVKAKKLEEEALPASFRVTELDISPGQVREGETVTVTAQVTNIGGTQGNYSATLILDGRIIATKGVILEAGSSMPVTFTLTERSSGRHTVEVDGLKGEFFIPPASFSLSNLTVNPGRVKEGEKVTVSVQVTNNGGCTGNYLAELKIRGVTEMTQQVTLPPGTSQVINFSTTKKKAGFYSVQIGDLMAKIIVEMADQFEEL